MERQILAKTTGSGAATTTETGGKTTASEGGHTDSQTVQENRGTVTTRTDEGTSALKQTGTVASEDQGTVSRETGSDTVNGTRENSGTQSQEYGRKVTSEGQTTDDTKELQGSTPDSTTYGAAGMPESLNWLYTSGQGERSASGTSHKTDTNSGADTRTDALKEETDQTTTYGKQIETDRTKTDTFNKTDTRTDDLTHTERVTGGDTTTTNGSGTTTGKVTESNNSETKNETNDQRDTDTRERYSGRHEAPQDLLDRARDYILRTSAFNWLVSQLEPCFIGVLGVF